MAVKRLFDTAELEQLASDSSRVHLLATTVHEAREYVRVRRARAQRPGEFAAECAERFAALADATDRVGEEFGGLL